MIASAAVTLDQACLVNADPNGPSGIFNQVNIQNVTFGTGRTTVFFDSELRSGIR
jgi:hypothetical protein